jgi:hypothetical protein
MISTTSHTQSVYRPGRSRYSDRWVTKEGLKLRLEDMSTSHLRNTIALIDRKCKETYADMGVTLCAGYGYIQGEMALMALESELDDFAACAPEDMLPPIYHDMVEELNRRGEPVTQP